MALTIGPAVRRGGLRLGSRVVHWLAMFIAAFMSYACLALIERGLLHTSVAAFVPAFVLLIGLAVLRDFGVRVPVPYMNLQVAEWLRDLLPQWGVAAAFGWLLGLGFATKFTYSLHTVFISAAALLLSPLAAAGVLAIWVSARLAVTFVGGNEIDQSVVCKRFAEMRVKLYLLSGTSGLIAIGATAMVVARLF